MNPNLPVLVLLGQPRPDIQIDELESTESQLTGQQIRRVEAEFAIEGDELNDRLLEELKPPKHREDALISDSAGGRWRVGNRSYSTRGNERFVHTIELHEHEDVTLTRIEFGQLSLVPEQWIISGGEPLVLTIMVTLEPSQNDEFEQALLEETESPYFPVRVVGIRKDATPMRFGRCFWQRLDDGRTRHVINLVAQAGDDESRSLGFSEPQLARLQEHSLIHGRKLDALIAELRNAGILDEDVIKRINDHADNPPRSAWREFDRTRRIEDFMRD